jgi:hypothetical protein
MATAFFNLCLKSLPIKACAVYWSLISSNSFQVAPFSLSLMTQNKSSLPLVVQPIPQFRPPPSRNQQMWTKKIPTPLLYEMGMAVY